MVALHISPHSCNIIREDLVDGDENWDTFSFLEASPPYKQWDSSLLHRETGAWIVGNSCAMYLSDACDGEDYDRDATVFLFRSTDNGASFQTLHKNGDNPSFEEMDDDDWLNLSVVGYGAVVYTINSAQNNYLFWKTTDGGDGTLSASALAPRIEFGRGVFATGNDTLVMNACAPSSMIVYYQNLACAITKLDSISVSGLDPSEYSLTSTNHNDCLSLPDTSYVTLTPDSTGTYPITVNAHFVDDEYNTIDTTLNFTLVVNAGSTPIPLSLYFKQSPITTAAGDTLEIPIYLSGNAKLDSISITIPFGIDTNVLRPIGFHSAIPGLTIDSIAYANGTETVPLQVDSITLNGETLIGYLRCIVYLADTLATTVTL